MPELRLEQSLVDERFEIVERLGQGSYAEIFVARDHADDQRSVVIKALNTSLQGTPDADLERTLIENFQNEAIALDRVRHPHVILRMGHGTAADLRSVPFHYLVLEYMPGGDLLSLCRSRPGNRLQLGEALSYFRQVCEALAYAHEQGIIHRDLKPNNLLASADHEVLKIADFGVAKMTTGDDTEITRVGAGIYAPPEHHPDEPDGSGPRTSVRRLTAAADIYSLAKTFYTVVCGRAPSQFVRRPITSLPESVTSEPWAAALLRVLERATADNVEDRHASVVEFWSDLASVASATAATAEVDEETQVRPRLRIARGDVPVTPEQPSFKPVLASVQVSPRLGPELLERTSGATLTQDRSPKIVVPIGKAPGLSAERAPRPSAKPPEKVIEKRFSLKRTLTASVRKRVFIVLLGIAFVGLLASVYHYARIVAPPKAIEVMTVNLNVRAGPSYQYPVLGTVTKGSRHRVLGQADNGWLRIEVSSWNESQPHDQLQKEGWVNGSDEYVSIAERRWW